MGVRTTVTLDEDIVERLRQESKSRGVSLRRVLNDALRQALLGERARRRRRSLKIRPVHMGYKTGLDYDDVASLVEYAEGKEHR